MLDLTIQEFNGEARALDLEIADALGFSRVRDIRQLIHRNLDVMGGLGEVCGKSPQTSELGGRPSYEYWLNEKQALYICTKSDAKNAVEITIQMIEVFTAWKAGKLEAYAPPPVTELPIDADIWRGLIREARLLFGRPAGVQLWRQSPLPQLSEMVADDPVGVPDVATPETEIMQAFLDQCCTVTGSSQDYVFQNEIAARLEGWMQEHDHPLWTAMQRSRALRRASDYYRARGSKARFAPKKRSKSGYIGIRMGQAHA